MRAKNLSRSTFFIRPLLLLLIPRKKRTYEEAEGKFTHEQLQNSVKVSDSSGN
jgi:hypothetical protein